MGKKKKKRGPRGGVKHRSGRDHNRKSVSAKKRRFARKSARKRAQQQNQAKQEWQQWDALTDDAKRLLGPAAMPKVPRPKNDEESSNR